MSILQWDDELLPTFVVFAIALVAILCLQRFAILLKMPPGPWGFPIVGYHPFLGKTEFSNELKTLSERYGNVFSIRLGLRLMVVLTDYESIKDALVRRGDIFSGRPRGHTSTCWFGNNQSIIATEGKTWKEQRKFVLKALKEFEFGKLSFEKVIQEEAKAALALIQNEGPSLDWNLLLSRMSMNVICHILFGNRFDYEDEKFVKLTRLVDELNRNFSITSYSATIPFLRFFTKSWKEFRKQKEALYSYVEDVIVSHEESFDANNPRDLIDIYLQKFHEIAALNPGTKLTDLYDDFCERVAKACFVEKKSFHIFTRQHLRANLTLLLVAGSDTISASMLWALTLMEKYPDIQTKVQEELDRVVGRSRLPSWTDRKSLPFTEATLLEIQRVATILPVVEMHSNIEETELEGYLIPKRTHILVNVWQVHNDPKLWKTPNKFDPSRFLDHNGNVVKPEHLIPFSTGNRICLGEPMARMEIFVFFCAILQSYSILKSEQFKSSVFDSSVKKLSVDGLIAVPRK